MNILTNVAHRARTRQAPAEEDEPSPSSANLLQALASPQPNGKAEEEEEVPGPCCVLNTIRSTVLNALHNARGQSSNPQPNATAKIFGDQGGVRVGNYTPEFCNQSKT